MTEPAPKQSDGKIVCFPECYDASHILRTRLVISNCSVVLGPSENLVKQMNPLCRKMPTCSRIHTTYYFQRVQGLSEVHPELYGAQAKKLCCRLVYSQEAACPRLPPSSAGPQLPPGEHVSTASGLLSQLKFRMLWLCNLTLVTSHFPWYHAQCHLLHQDEVSGGLAQPWLTDDQKALTIFTKRSGHRALNAKTEREGVIKLPGRADENW